VWKIVFFWHLFVGTLGVLLYPPMLIVGIEWVCWVIKGFQIRALCSAFSAIASSSLNVDFTAIDNSVLSNFEFASDCGLEFVSIGCRGALFGITMEPA
jgi:hypothetical protein